jgi:hypothetical protein
MSGFLVLALLTCVLLGGCIAYKSDENTFKNVLRQDVENLVQDVKSKPNDSIPKTKDTQYSIIKIHKRQKPFAYT